MSTFTQDKLDIGTYFIFAVISNKFVIVMYSKSRVQRLLSKRPKLVSKTYYRLMLVKSIARMLQGEHSTMLSTFIKLPFVVKIFVSSIFEWVLLYC